MGSIKLSGILNPYTLEWLIVFQKGLKSINVADIITLNHPLGTHKINFGKMEGSAITEEVEDLLTDIHRDVRLSKKSTIKPLKKYMRQYPDVPQFSYHLLKVYLDNDMNQPALKLLGHLRQRFPDYLFGVTTEVSLKLIWDKDLEAALDLLGPGLSLPKRFPDRGLFHYTEALQYYHVAIQVLLEQHKLEAAKERHELMLQIAEGHPTTEDAFERIVMHELEQRIENLKRIGDTRHAEVRNTAPYPQTEEMPVFHHSEIESLYRFSLGGLPREKREAIASLPAKTLAQDLRLVLEDSMRRWDYFQKMAEDKGGIDEMQMDFVLHALHLLAYLPFPEALPALLDFLRQEEAFWEFYVGDQIVEEIEIYISQLGVGYLDRLQQFMQSRWVSGMGKARVSSGVAQLVHHDPASRSVAEDWFRQYFEFSLEHPDDGALVDQLAISTAASDAACMGAKPLLPLIQQLFEKGLANPTFAGSYEEMVAEAESAPEPYFSIPWPADVHEAYERSYLDRRAPHPDTEKFEALREDFENPDRYEAAIREMMMERMFGSKEKTEMPAPPPKPAERKKVGRNAPCPCGSGKKYKHCCLRK